MESEGMQVCSGSEHRELESTVEGLEVREGRDTGDTEPWPPVLGLQRQDCSFQELKIGLTSLRMATATC